MNRRLFILAGGGMLAAQTAPSNQVNLGVIGPGSRGSFVMGVFQKDPALRIGAICDVYEPNLERAISEASRIPGNHPKQYRNYKELLADKDIEAVLIATPEHWHAQMVLDALAGVSVLQIAGALVGAFIALVRWAGCAFGDADQG
jgi:predicted homoserine dehydrogenase-like protein